MVQLKQTAPVCYRDYGYKSNRVTQKIRCISYSEPMRNFIIIDTAEIKAIKLATNVIDAGDAQIAEGGIKHKKNPQK